MSAVPATHEREAVSLFQADIVRRALLDSLIKLDPRVQIRNPVMFVVEIGALITTIAWLIQFGGGKPLGGGNEPAWFTFTVSIWLWLTVVFANIAEAFAEGRGRAQASTLRAMRKETIATLRDGSTKPASELTRGDVVVVESGEMIPGDGTVIEGIATVDESAITGESAPVIRESGGDRSAVTGGTRVTSDRIVVEITQQPGHSFMDRMIALVEGAERRKTPNEIALGILLAALTLVFVIVVAALRPFGLFADTAISETTLPGTSGVLVHTYTFEVDHDFRRWLTAIGKFTYGTYDYQGDGRSDKTYSIEGDVIYKMTRNLWLKGTLRRDILNSNAALSSSASTVVLVGVRLQN